MTAFFSTSGDGVSWLLGTHRHGAACADLAGRQKYGRNVVREINHAICAGTNDHDSIWQYFDVLPKFQISVERHYYVADATSAAQ